MHDQLIIPPSQTPLPPLPKWGKKAFKLLTQGREWKKLHYPGQVVTYIDPPEFKINEEKCVLILNDYFAPETCDGDYNKVKYEGCEFAAAILYDALSRVSPGDRGVCAFGVGTFRSTLHEWGTDYEELEQEYVKEYPIKLTLELSKFCDKVTLTVTRNEYDYYAKIEQTKKLFATDPKKEPSPPISKNNNDKKPRKKGIPKFIPNDEEVEFVKVGDKPAELSFSLDFRGKTNSYHRDETTIEEIITKDHHKVKPIWKETWTEISPGIKTYQGTMVTRCGNQEHADNGTIQVDRSACPVYIQIRKFHEYVDYDGDYSSSSGYTYWVIYEAEAGLNNA